MLKQLRKEVIEEAKNQYATNYRMDIASYNHGLYVPIVADCDFIIDILKTHGQEENQELFDELTEIADEVYKELYIEELKGIK